MYFFSNSETQRKTRYSRGRAEGDQDSECSGGREPETVFAQGSTSDHVSPK